MALEALISSLLEPIQLAPSELQRLGETLQSLPARSIRRKRCSADLDLDFLSTDFFSTLQPIAWHPYGYWWDEARGRPGAEPLYAAAGYFIQDAASMLPLSLLDPQPGEIVCDLCAAPGGKATAIAEAIGEQGWLLANEAIQSRLAPLELNLARTGSDRYITTNMDPERLAECLPSQFDAVLVDAPCSGQTLIGKGKQSYSSLSPAAIELNASRQQRILAAAAKLVRPGGRLVYSTCTLATRENEEQIDLFLQSHANWEAGVSHPASLKISEALPQLESPIRPGSYRLWPHRDRCAGGFAALLHCRAPASLSPLDEEEFEELSHRDIGRKKRAKHLKTGANRLGFGPLAEIPEIRSDLGQWGELSATEFAVGAVQAFAWRDSLPAGWLALLHGGPEIAYKKGSQWFPAHGLALRNPSGWKPSRQIELETGEVSRFMAGETIRVGGRSQATESGWNVATWNRLPLGWLKVVDGIGKNHIPKSARLNLH